MYDQANDNTCVVCFKNVLYYSIGECDHPVCFECSTRMRVLCLQNECPICRQDLARVVFTDTIQLYKDLRNQVFTDRLFERQFKIGFSNEAIKQAYDKLLDNCCYICGDKTSQFRKFGMLSDHMRKVHEKYYCDLCVKHLKIFTNERKCYTRQELAHHRRKGDLDDTSHRGHPLCEFCEERFMDADELYRHLRKEHLYCHLCDADGKNLYYATHSALAHHFRSDHFLCEEGECAGQHLTAVFRTEIDLKAHKATIHGRGLTRGAARQARTLELQFNITPHPVVLRTPRDYNRERNERPPSPPPTPPPAPPIDPHSDAQFPRLSTAPPAPALLQGGNNKAYKGASNLARTDRNFPTLGGAAASTSRPSATPSSTSSGKSAPTVAATILRNAKPGVSIQLQSQPASASNFRLTPASGNRISIPNPRPRLVADDDFPSLSGPKDDYPSLGASTPQPPKVVLINSEEMQALKSNQQSSQQKRPQQMNAEAFPALSSSSEPAAPPQWIAISKSKAKQKPVKLDPPPQPRELAYNPVADFPNLPVNTKPKKKSPQPAPPSPPAQLEIKPTKKEKKKLNQIAKKENALVDVPIVNGLDKKYARDPSFTDVNISNNIDIDRKIKTIETVPEAALAQEKHRNGKGDFALASKDYPPLNPKSANAKSEPSKPSKKMQNGSPASGLVPPGFGPPGFKARPACNGMTFTNSSGQTFSAPVHAYITPPDFERRNRELVKKFTVALGGPEAVEEFKVASRAFREGIIGANEFYEHCRNAMGSQTDDVFPDLVALLPDIAKQQELMVGRNLPGLDVCATCGQLIPLADFAAHRAAHWPPLASR